MPDVIFQSKLAIGDIVVMTSAIRAFAEARPDFKVAVDTTHPDVWINNPHLTPIDTMDQPVVVPISYKSLLDQSNQRNVHFTAGYLHDINRKLGLSIQLRDMRPDIHLTDAEKEFEFDIERPYWVLMAGGKTDFKTKWWDPLYFQQVVDMMDGYTIVSVGGADQDYFYTAKVTNVVDLVGKTTIRELIRLVYFSRGVICPVTCGAHMAAAFNKPCVVIAGGREPYWWQAYTPETWKANCTTDPPEGFVGQTFLHAIGRLSCCTYGGCGKTTIDSTVNPGNNCLHVRQGPSMKQPACLKLTSPFEVVEAVCSYDSHPRIVQRLDNHRPIKHIGSPITICVVAHGGPDRPRLWSKSQERHLTYHEMHRRCIESIIDNTPAGTYELRIGCNSVCLQTETWLDRCAESHPNIKLYKEPVNIGKSPLMRRMFAGDDRDTSTIAHLSFDAITRLAVKDDYIIRHQPRYQPRLAGLWSLSKINLNTEWLVWLDDDAYIQDPNWIYEIDDIVGSCTDDVGCIGYLYKWPTDLDQYAWITTRKWWKNVPLEEEGPKFRMTFCTGAFWIARVAALKVVDWPDANLWQQNDDVLLGEALRQNGYTLKALAGEPAVIEDVGRRGMFQPTAGTIAGAGDCNGRIRNDPEPDAHHTPDE